ncbi:hypothetical protein X759_27500 [Mesorhizobium sp. LSHC420B00]|uniref:hypothetical protein n=1 Tax=Mesorhizobium sp. M1300 TaxID=2957077 RepID=UPI0003CF1C5E|nr:hypothetical protein X759_27500 [Mesorhizobium sp. LSHC420B00]
MQALVVDGGSTTIMPSKPWNVAAQWPIISYSDLVRCLKAMLVKRSWVRSGESG